jgi:FHS family L-fucose permease-like MFS transporter
MNTISSNTPAARNAPSASYKSALVVVTTLFFMWGFLTCLNDILVSPSEANLRLKHAKIMFMQFAFFRAYFLFSVPMGKIVALVGYK